MKLLKSIFRLALMVIASFVSASAADSGTAIMERCTAKFKNSPSLTVNFVVAHAAGSDEGTLVLSKKLFKLSTPAMAVWFDGTTQWSYLRANNEVNITEPTGEELLETNPFEIISSFKDNFNCKSLKSSPGNDIVELTPKNGDLAIRSVKITISKSTGWPTSMIITFENGATTSVSVTKVTGGKALTSSAFKYDPKSYPGTAIIDLR